MNAETSAPVPFNPASSKFNCLAFALVALAAGAGKRCSSRPARRAGPTDRGTRHTKAHARCGRHTNNLSDITFAVFPNPPLDRAWAFYALFAPHRLKGQVPNLPHDGQVAATYEKSPMHTPRVEKPFQS